MARIIWKSIGIVITASVLVGAVIWGYRMRPSDEPCVSLEFFIEDSDERMYLTESELTNMLREQQIYPVGQVFNRRSLQRIENAVRRHPMVRTAECYATPRNEMRVRLTQRVPLVRIQVPGETYLIDTDRKVMQARACVKDSVLLVTGAVNAHKASTQIADFAEWLQDESYWSQRIHHIHLETPNKVVLWVPQRVNMGPMNGYTHKLKKLRTFLDNSPEEVKQKNYYELDIRFRGQVIGRYL